MSVQNVLWKLTNARRGAIVTLTAAATLTLKQVRAGFVVMNANAAVTLPAAADQYKGCVVDIGCLHASGCTVVVAAGFAGGSTAGDTLTLAQGDACRCWCDGSYWYGLNVTTNA